MWYQLILAYAACATIAISCWPVSDCGLCHVPMHAPSLHSKFNSSSYSSTALLLQHGMQRAITVYNEQPVCHSGLV